MPDYSKGKIYTIRNRNNDSQIYVGSTIQSLAVRFGGHKKSSKLESCMNMKLYQEVNNDWNNWYIELYENYPCTNREELFKREGEIIRLIGTLNIRISGRDNKQYYIDNIYKLKQYQLDNSEHIKEYKKQYRIDNAEKIKEYDKNRKNKEERLEIRKEKSECICGCKISMSNMSKHKKSQNHLNFLKAK
jgi:hypothetical protein